MDAAGTASRIPRRIPRRWRCHARPALQSGNRRDDFGQEENAIVAAVPEDAAEARLRLILQHLPHPTHVWRRQGDDFVLADFNHAADALTRGGVGQLTGLPLSQTFAARPDVIRDIHACAETATVIHREDVFHLRSIGESRLLSVTYAFAPPDMVIVHTHDLSELRRLEEALREAQKMEAVGRLAGGIAHDFNNLLTIILGYGELLQARSDVPAEVARDATEIVKAAASAAALTRQLLAFSRRSVLEPRVLDVNHVVEHVRSLIERLLGPDIQLEVRLAPETRPVRVDPGHLEQVIMNLAANARDAMPNGGRLTIETGNVTLNERYVAEHPGAAPGDHAVIAMSDTGVGMSDEVKARLFEPFFTTKELGQGTGLGLATVYGAVKQSGGSIAVSSEPGHGSIFQIFLPIIDGRS
jgi:signal transduction histidine kinase